MEMMEPLNVSFPTEGVDNAPAPKESSGNFGIGPLELAKFTDLDGTHPIAKGEDMLLSTKLFLDFGGYDKLEKMIKTNYSTGIDVNTIAERKQVFGVNSFPPLKIKTLWTLVAENFKDCINIILLVAAIVSLAIGLFKDGFPKGLINGVSILIALGIIIVVSSANNY